jgi:hypothetical protein
METYQLGDKCHAVAMLKKMISDKVEERQYSLLKITMTEVDTPECKYPRVFYSEFGVVEG